PEEGIVRGQGKLYQAKYRAADGVVRKVPMWSWDYTLRGCTCGTCDKDGRHREPSGTTDYAVATELLAQRIAARKMGAPVATEAPTVTLAAFVAEHIARRRQSRKFTESWVDVNERHLARAVAHFG